jgi:hypothetical protein
MSRTETKMSMEHWWNDTERGEPNYWEKKLSECHFVHHKSHMDCPRIEPRYLR